MKKIVILSLSALILAGCGGGNNANRQTVGTNTPPAAPQQNNTLVVSSHSTDKTATAPSNSSSTLSSQPASPNSKPIDVSEMTANIEKAQKEFKAKPADAKTKENLAAAYFERAFALTEAAQYRSALGDFRKGLKLNPNNKEAKAMHDQIISIFESIGREPPKEGEEPPPLPYK
ncbi:MAG TPA: tetratricopeptide repeat protein [Pyrinomonadaceae bacterium]|jgi:tetratricopeptide (TPR) repeat protein